VRSVLNKHAIIIIDDELLIRDLLYDFFAEKGWQVTVSDSGANAVEMLKNQPYDIALVDLKMPEMDGLSFIRKIKNLGNSMPVIVMTAFPSFETAVEALRLKVEDYITKPFNINKLYKTVVGLLDERKKEREAIKSDNY
jgi:DNA-binding response OmpR family regulator